MKQPTAAELSRMIDVAEEGVLPLKDLLRFAHSEEDVHHQIRFSYTSFLELLFLLGHHLQKGKTNMSITDSIRSAKYERLFKTLNVAAGTADTLNGQLLGASLYSTSELEPVFEELLKDVEELQGKINSLKSLVQNP